MTGRVTGRVAAAGPVAAGPVDAYPLAPSQELLWEFMTALSPDDPTGSRELVIGCRRVCGRVDEAAFRAAVDDVIEHHAMLRLVFRTTDHAPLVHVRPRMAAPLSTLDLSGQPERVQWERLSQVVHSGRTATFDLRHGPLWRVWLVRLAPTVHVLVFVFCHLIADGWSSRVFTADLVRAYRARLGHDRPLDSTRLSFAEITRAQRAGLADPTDPADHSRRAAYWRRCLTPLPTYLPLPARAVPPDTDLVADASHRFTFAADVCEDLRRLAWRARTTGYVALMAAYHILVARRTGTGRRVVIGTTTLGRHTTATKRVIGQFTNDTYVPVLIRPEASGLETVREVHRGVTEAAANLLPFTELAVAVHPGFAASRPWPDNHLFDSYFQAAEPEAPSLVFPELRVDPVPVDSWPVPPAPPLVRAGDVSADRQRVWAKRGAPIVIIDDDRRGGAMVHNPGFFGTDLVAGLVAEYLAIVTALVRHPDRPVATLAPSGAPGQLAAGVPHLNTPEASRA